MQNAFSVALSSFGFDFHKMLTVDLLHEVEIGVWKSLFTHIVRMLHACGADKVHKFDKRSGLFEMELNEHTHLRPAFGWLPHSATRYAASRRTFRK